MAEHLIVFSIGFPAADYPSTTLFWAAAYYIPCALFIFGIFGFLTVLPTLYASFAIKACNKNKDWFLPLNCFGGLIFFITIILYNPVNTLYYNIDNYIRASAYLLDYQNLKNYPGLPKNQKSILHANGVVSLAEPRGKTDIVISVYNLNDNK